MSTLSREKAEKARLRGGRAKKRVRENRARGKARVRGGRAMKGSGADRVQPFGGGKGAAGRVRGGRGRDSDRRTEKSVKFRGGLKYETAAV